MSEGETRSDTLTAKMQDSVSQTAVGVLKLKNTEIHLQCEILKFCTISNIMQRTGISFGRDFKHPKTRWNDRDRDDVFNNLASKWPLKAHFTQNNKL